MRAHLTRRLFAGIAVAAVSLALGACQLGSPDDPDQVLEWNQIFIDTLIATNTANSSSQRLGAIVHTAIFDAYNGIERRYTPIFVDGTAPPGASRRAAVIAAAYTALVGLFPSRTTGGARRQLCGLARGAERRRRRRRPIARTRHRLGHRGGPCVLAWRANDGFARAILLSRRDSGRPVAADTAGFWTDERPGVGLHLAVRPRQPTPVPACTAAHPGQQHLHGRFQHASKRSDGRPDRRALKTRRRSRRSGKAMPASTGIRPPTRLRAPITCRCPTAIGCSRCLNIAMADTAITTWSAKRHYGAIPTEVTWRPVTAIALATLTAILTRPRIPTGCHSSRHRRIRNTQPGTLRRTARRQLCSSATSTTLRLYADDGSDSRAATIPASRRRGRMETTRGSGVGCTIRARSPSATSWARRSPITST